MVKISVVIPIYKVEKYLRECVDSVLNQSYTNIEVILVDDGSPDGCPAICDEYAKADSRVMVIHKPNGGLSDARNRGVKSATGDYILFIDSDDFWDDCNGVQLLVEELDKTDDVDLIFFRKKTYLKDMVFMPPKIDSDYIRGKDKLEILSYLTNQGDLITSAYTKLIKRSLLIDNDIEFEKGLLSEDLDWSLNLYIHAKKVHAVDNPFYGYRKRADSITTSMKRKNFVDLLYIINKWRTIIPELFISDAEKRIYMGFLCYEYSILLGLLYRADRSTRNEMMRELRKLTYLLQYDVNYKTHRVVVLYRLFGLDITAWILQQYIKYRQRTF